MKFKFPKTKKRRAKKRAFTIIELLIVIAVVLILAATAISGSGGIIRSLRFGNAFNRTVFMVQQARSMAITSKGDAAAYGVDITFNTRTVELFSEDAAALPQKTVLETFNLEPTTGLAFFANNSASGTTPTSCLNSASISFARGSAQAKLLCDGTEISLLQAGVLETISNRSKTFIIHGASGIPQVQ